MKEVGNESWLPICLPKFNQEGFLHVYVTFVREEVGLVWVSGEKGAFEELREGRRRVMEVSADGRLRVQMYRGSAC